MKNLKQFLEKTIFNDKLFCISLLVFSYLVNVYPLVRDFKDGKARYIIIWGSLILLHNIFIKGKIFKTRFFLPLALFSIFLLVGMVFSPIHNYGAQLADIILLIITLFIIYPIFVNDDKKQATQFLKIICFTISIIILINTIISFVLLIQHTNILYFLDSHGTPTSYTVGVNYDSRFTGLQGNSNILAWATASGIIANVILLSLYKKKNIGIRVGLVFSLLLNLLCLILTESRGAFYSLLISFILVMGIYWIRKNFISKKTNFVRRLTSFILIASIAMGSFVVSNVVKDMVYEDLNAKIASEKAPANTIGNIPKQGNLPKEEPDASSAKKRKISDDITTGRVDLWKIGFDTLLHENVLFGITNTNSYDIYYKYFPAKFSGTLTDAGNMHNFFLQALLCNGIVGLLCILIFSCCLLKYLFKNLMKVKDSSFSLIVSLLFGTSVIFLMGMFENIILYAYSNLLNYVFFIMLGALVYFIDIDRKSRKSNKILVVSTTDSMIWNFLVPHINFWGNKGYEVECATSKTGFYFDELKKSKKIDMIEIPFERNPFKFNNLKSFIQLNRLAKKNAYDFIICQEPVGGVLARIVGYSNQIKVIYTAHGFHFYKGAPKQNWILYYTIERMMSAFTDTLITINEEDYQQAKKFNARRVLKIDGIGVDLKRFDKAELNVEEKKKELGIHNDDKIILTVAEMIPRKNYETALHALAKIKNKKYLYLICGDGELSENLKELVKQLGLEKHVKFLGFRKDISEIYQISDVFLFPTFQEGLSIALMEAMAAGLPIVCSKIRGNTDLIVQEKGGYLYAPNDVDGFAEGIETCLSGKALKFGVFNQKYVMKYSIQNSMDQFFKAIETTKEKL